ncbi:lysophospholipase-like protein 1 isoform X2 [Pectinophora gossypiella]|nr:lysophospholipase-like protein 1 isoform X2 [Pectinophora gossypiella]
MKEWIKVLNKNFTFPHIKVLYPTAPRQPYTPAGGQLSNVWFDRLDINPFVPEHLDSLAKIEVEVRNLIQKEHEAGIPSNRIVVGGFSMGGALSLHVGYLWDRNLAGVFAHSSFLPTKSIIYNELKADVDAQFAVPPLLQVHGNRDTLVELKWGKETFNQLKSLGVKGEFHVLDKVDHSISRKSMELIKDWVTKVLPEDSK